MDVDPEVLALLQLGAYQLLRTRIPSHAAVATTVELARATGNARATGFVNAVLRKISARTFEQWCDDVGRGASPMGHLALRHCHPGWIVGAFTAALTEDGTAPDLAEVEAALAADDERPVTHLVAWPGRLERDALVAESGGVPAPYSPFGVRLESGGSPGALASVREHRAGVQDEGSQLCALALSELPLTGPDQRWLDLCAGPGGKAALLAALADRRGAVLTANELHPHRAELIAAAVEGWQVDIRVGDARDLPGDDRGFDRILLDAPCTGLGALRRRPEARWRRTPDDLAALVELQADLLDAAIRLVRPGGVIGYVTCSPHPAETLEQIDDLFERRKDVELLDARPAFPGVDQLGDSLTVQLWPHRHGTDAMFFAALRRL
jgi:16S rRNA (cytosine967-C5)-methyltransferase